MMFSLPSTRATLSSLNCRNELHGTDRVPTVDLGFTLTVSNVVLDSLGCGPLRKMFYTKGSGAGDEQGTLTGVSPISDTPNLRSDALLMPVKLDLDLTGYTVVIDRGLGDEKSNIALADCKVNKFGLDLLNGGSVEIAVRVQKAGVDDHLPGLLLAMLGAETAISLTPPSVEAQQQMAA